MRLAGIIAEYDPFHLGHRLHLEETKKRLGREDALVVAMSGNFTQRGDFALVRKQARAEAAVRGGADLVLELPLPWAAASAERFADGGVALLAAAGVELLSFGSECGDAAALLELARGLLRPEFSTILKEELVVGDSFAAARQRAAARLLGERARLLETPNNTLGIEYSKAILRRGLSMETMSIPRRGAAHNGETAEGIASASHIRALLRRGEGADQLLPPETREILEREVAAGRAPVDKALCQRAILARLRTLPDEAFAAVDSGGEGLGNRLRDAARRAVDIELLLDEVKTKRYARARLQRMLLWAYLGLDGEKLPQEIPYLRPLAMNERGRQVLAALRDGKTPILTKPADVRRLGQEAQALFAQEAAATDLYVLAYPDLRQAGGGSAWRESPLCL